MKSCTLCEGRGTDRVKVRRPQKGRSNRKRVYAHLACVKRPEVQLNRGRQGGKVTEARRLARRLGWFRRVTAKKEKPE